jgi:hypothetical protein
MDGKGQEQIALHRWAVIAEAAGQKLTPAERGALVRQIAARAARAQGHRDHQPDHQRIRHDPLPLRGPQPPLRDRLAHRRLDHPVAEAHQVRQPRVRQHRPVPAHHRGRGHHRAAEHRRLARRRRRIPATVTVPPRTRSPAIFL